VNKITVEVKPAEIKTIIRRSQQYNDLITKHKIRLDQVTITMLLQIVQKISERYDTK